MVAADPTNVPSEETPIAAVIDVVTPVAPEISPQIQFAVTIPAFNILVLLESAAIAGFVVPTPTLDPK